MRDLKNPVIFFLRRFSFCYFFGQVEFASYQIFGGGIKKRFTHITLTVSDEEKNEKKIS